MHEAFENKRVIVNCLGAVFSLGLVAHAIGIIDFTINHDSLREYYLSFATSIKLSSGRFLEPLLRTIMGEYVTLTWLSGIVSLFAIGVSVTLVSNMFSLKKTWQHILLSGISVTNISITATIASYIHDFMGNSISLLFATATAYLWAKTRNKFSFKIAIVSIVCMFVSLGLYQAYLSVTTTLICIFCLKELLAGTEAKNVIFSILRAIVIVAIATTIYLLCTYAIKLIFDLSLKDNGVGALLGDGNLSSTKFMTRIVLGYGLVFLNFVLPNYANAQAVFEPTALFIGILNIVLIIIAGCIIIRNIRLKKIKRLETLLIIGIILSIPLCMSCVMIVSNVFHELLRYSFYLFYLLILVVFNFLPEKQDNSTLDWHKITVISIIGFIILNNIQLSNMAYTQKKLQQQAALSLMTRIIHSLEQYDNYEYGISNVAFIGEFFDENAGWENDALKIVSGMEYIVPFTMPEALDNYFDLVLQYPINLVSEGIGNLKSTQEFKAMPDYPAKGSIKEINGIIVVKLNNSQPQDQS